MATSYKKTVIKTHAQKGTKLTSDALYWNNLEFPVTKKEHGAVTHIEFSPVEPYDYAVTSSVRVQIHSGRDHDVVKSFSRFREVAYCGSYRLDGKLLAAGGDEGVVRLFDVSGKTLLRTFRGHSGATHVSRFMADNIHLMSGSDDKTVRIWDIASQSEVSKYSDSTDYIRCGVTSKTNKDIIVAGSYDHKVRLYDSRTADGIVLSVNHGHPVESVLLFPTGGLVISAGGNVVKVWDILSGGRLLATCANHHKTVTSLAFCSQHKRLVSGSIDRHVKIYDMGTYQPVHSLDYPSAILSLDVAPDDSLLAVGMSDGLLSVQRRKDEADVQQEKLQRHREKKASFRYTLQAKKHIPQQEDIKVTHQKKAKLEKYDQYLRHFDHSKALDAAMDIRVRTHTPHITICVMQELMRRNVLKAALAGRDNKSLMAILKFLQKNISSHKLIGTVIDVCNLLLGLYKDELGESTEVGEALLQLKKTIETEVHYMHNCMEIMGMLETLFSSAESVEQGTYSGLQSTPANVKELNMQIFNNIDSGDISVETVAS